MTLLWLLCVSLVLGGFLHRREVRAFLEDLRLGLFGVRVRVRKRPAVGRPVAGTSRHDFLPPPRVVTRAGP